MKKLMFAVVCAAALSSVNAADAEVPVAAEKPAAPVVKAEPAPAKPVDVAAMKAAREKRQAERMAKAAELAGVPLEEWKALSPAERRQRSRQTMEKQLAEKKGISVEELQRQRDERDAKFVGMSVEQWKALDEQAKRAKKREAVTAKMAAQKAARKAGPKPPAPEAKPAAPAPAK